MDKIQRSSYEFELDFSKDIITADKFTESYEYDSFLDAEMRLLYIFGLPNIKACTSKLRSIIPQYKPVYSIKDGEVLNQLNSFAQSFLFKNNMKYRNRHLQLATSRKDDFEDIAFAVRIEENPYTRFVYKNIYCQGKCIENNFFKEVDRIDLNTSKEIKSAFLIYRLDFNWFEKKIMKLGLTFETEFIEIFRRGGIELDLLFMEAPWYER